MMRFVLPLFLLSLAGVPASFAGDGCLYKRPPLFKDQDTHLSDDVCQRCENGIWVDRYCSVCDQSATNSSDTQRNNVMEQQAPTPGNSTDSTSCNEGPDNHSNGARRGGPGNRQVCGNGTWTVTEPDSHTVCSSQ